MATKGRTKKKKLKEVKVSAKSLYNKDIMKQYQTQLKSYNDSTTSYNLQLQKNKLINEANASYGEDGIRKRNQKKVANLTKKQKDLGIYLKNEPTYTMDKAYNYVRNEDNRIMYPENMGLDPNKTRYKTTNASSLKPKRKPTKPVRKVVKEKIKKIPVKEKEFKPKKVPGYLINKRKKKNKFKKFVSSLNPFTGKKVIRKKRKVRNLVTGKNNRIS
tara:strand:+ start:76 stop:723 length:648 start_codon:yes stop_codon:yes gene_type:complete